MKELEATKSEIIRCIVEFYNDPDIIEKFVDEFFILLERFARLMNSTPYEESQPYLNFKDEITDVYDYLIKEGYIYEIAKLPDSNPVISARRRNKSPLSMIIDRRTELKKATSDNPLTEFVTIYGGLFPKQEPTKKTFSTNLDQAQLKRLRKELIDDNFIYNNITQDEFDYIFSGKPIIPEMKPIKWKLHRGLTALRELIYLLTGETVHKDQVRKCFIDEKDKPFEIPKPKRGEYSKKHYAQPLVMR